MTLILDESRGPKGKIEIITRSFGPLNDFLHLSGDGCVSLRDAVEMVEYILTNTDLIEDDPRIQLRERVLRSKVAPGYNTEINPNSRRIVLGPR